MNTRLPATAAALLDLLPHIRRTRFWRLYGEDGRRFLDLWSDGGRGILGSKGDGLGRTAKAGIDKGLAGPFPSIHSARLEKALRAWKPGYAAARFFLSEERALAALTEISGTLPVPAIERPFGEHIGLHREPDGRTQNIDGGAVLLEKSAGASAALAVLPCPAAFSPSILLFRDALSAAATRSDAVPPLQFAVAARSLAELARFSRTYDEKLWKRSDSRIDGVFSRSGPWLFPLHGRERHPAFFEACLGAGLLVSPDYDLPSLVPGDFDDGELKTLRNLRY